MCVSLMLVCQTGAFAIGITVWWSAGCDICLFFFFKQKTAYDVRISDWSSDVCSSDLTAIGLAAARRADVGDAPVVTLATAHPAKFPDAVEQIGRASCRERVCQYV